jgi:pyruvate kinase
VLTTSERVARQCFGVLKGCEALVLPSLEATDMVVTETINGFRTRGLAKPGEPIVIVHGTNAKVGATNTMRIQYA